MRQQFLHYTLITEIKSSHASTSYLAFSDQQPQQKVFLKTFLESSFVDQLKQQQILHTADTLKQLRHPHIVPVLEAGKDEGLVYVASEYMPGGSLRIRLDRAYPQTLPLQQALTIISHIGQALAALHTMHIVHGHLNPEHVLFDAHGQVWLTDGYVTPDTLLEQDDSEQSTYSLLYRAPEQFQDQNDALSDQYALCCIAYELFTGRVPLVNASGEASPSPSAPVSLNALVPELSATIDAAVLRGLAANPSQRHPDIPALLALLQPALSSSPTSALPLPRAKRAKPASSPQNTRQTTGEASSPLSGLEPSSVASDPLRSTQQTNMPVKETDDDPIAALLAPSESLLTSFSASPPANKEDEEPEFDRLLEEMSHQENLFLSGSLQSSMQAGQQYPHPLLAQDLLASPAQSAPPVLTVPQTEDANSHLIALSQPVLFRRSQLRFLSLWAAVALLLIGSLIGYSLLVAQPSSPVPPHALKPTSTTSVSFIPVPNMATGTASIPARSSVTPSSTKPAPRSSEPDTTGSSPSVPVSPGARPTPMPTPTPTPMPRPTPTPVPVVSSLSGSYQEYNVNPTNLTSVGTSDWVHWGYGGSAGAVDRSNTGAYLISSYGLLTGGTVSANGTWPIDFSWSNGTPVSGVSTTTSCIYVKGLDNGFTLSVPASTTTRTLYVYVGVYKGRGRLTASIQGGPTYVDASLDMTTDPNLADNARYTLHFSSNVAGTRLYISWALMTDDGTAGNVQLESAALSG